MSKTEYTPADIKVLGGLEAIRARPGMYAGDPHDGTGLFTLFCLAVDYGVHQYLAGECSEILVELHADGSCLIDDDGPGFDVTAQQGVALERLMTCFSYHYCDPALAPVLLCPVTALSEWTEVDVFRAGEHYRQRFAKGLVASPLQKLGPTNRHGTRIGFLPDPEILSPARFDRSRIHAWLVDAAANLAGLRFKLRDLRLEEIQRSSGLLSLLRTGDSVAFEPFHVVDELEGVRIEVAAVWERASSPRRVESFVNHQRTAGEHPVAGLMLGLHEGFRCAVNTPRSWNERSESTALDAGLHAAVAFQTRPRKCNDSMRQFLSSAEERNLMRRVISREFAAYLRREPELLEHLTRRMRAE